MIHVFVGGSRRVSRLPEEARIRIDNIVERGLSVLVGDANGVDKAVQEYLADAHYDQVTVFCSGDSCRNNVGQWRTRHIRTQGRKRDFQFYAAKDREMAKEAEFGLMIWDGKSPGTILNVLRLIQNCKKAVLIDVAEKRQVTFACKDDWDTFLLQCKDEVRSYLDERIARSEKVSLFQEQEGPKDLATNRPEKSLDASVDFGSELDVALGNSDPRAFLEYLGKLARVKGMSRIAQETGLAREALYRALSADGNPEFATILKVSDALGLQLRTAKKASI